MDLLQTISFIYSQDGAIMPLENIRVFINDEILGGRYKVKVEVIS